MAAKPEFFWSPPDNAPIVGITTYRGVIIVATASGVYTIGEPRVMDNWEIRKISVAVERNEEPEQ